MSDNKVCMGVPTVADALREEEMIKHVSCSRLVAPVRFDYHKVLSRIIESQNNLSTPPNSRNMGYIGGTQQVVKKEETGNMRCSAVLSMWKLNAESKVKNEYNSEVESARAKDSLQLALGNASNMFIKTLESEFPDLNTECFMLDLERICSGEYSDETKKSISDLTEVFHEQLINIRSKFDEVTAMLSCCETYEQEMTVLNSYGIVVDGKIVK